MTDRTGHDPALDTFVNDLWNARYADPRFGHEDYTPFPSLIARADELGDDYWRFVVRLEAASSALWSGTATDVLTLLAWLLRAHDAQSAHLGLEASQLEQLHISLVDFLEVVTDIPDIPLEQAQGVLDDWIGRVRGTEYDSAALVALVRAKIAVHRGEPADARHILDACRDFTPPTGTCEQGVRGSVAALYSRLGDYDRAVELSEPDLVDNGRRCGFFPGETYVALAEAYAADGRHDEVVAAADAVERIYRQFSRTSAYVAVIPALLRMGELDRANRIAVDRVPYLDHCFTELGRAELAAVLSAVFASVAQADPDAVVPQRADRGPAQLRNAAELASELADLARDIARRFDIRNASNAISTRIDQMLAVRAADGFADGAVPAKPDDRVKPIGERSADELMRGLAVFSMVSTRRAAACAEALAGRLTELSGRSLARARIMLASDLRRTDPAAALDALREAAAAARPDYPSMAAQAELMADVEAAEQGLIDPARLLEAPAPDPQWSALSQANYWRFVAATTASLDTDHAAAAVDAGLDVLARGLRGELPLVDEAVDEALPARSSTAEAATIETALHVLAASIHADSGLEPDADVDRALVAARRLVEHASTPDQRLEAHAELAGTLGFAAQVQAYTDESAALVLMNEAVEHARYAQRAPMLAHRAELRLTVSGDFDGAADDHEAAIAVWMVEGLDHAADVGVIDLARVQLARGDEPRSIIEALRPVVDRLSERGDEVAVANGLATLGRAQVAAGLADDAVISFTRVLDSPSGHEHPGYLAQLHQARAGELMDLGRFPEAIGDFDGAAELFDEIGARHDLTDVLRSAALAAHFGGDGGAAAAYLDRAGRVCDELSVEEPVDFERARLDLARADIIRAAEAERAQEILDAVIERSRAANWMPITLSALQISALIALEPGTDAGRDRAAQLIDEGLRLDPEHPGLNRLAFELADED